MGSGKFTKCPNCGDEQEYYLGIGFAFSDALNVINLFPKAAQKKIEQISLVYDLKHENLSYKIFECIHCDTSHSRLALTVKYNGGKIYQQKYKCSECGRKLSASKRKLNSFKCRGCRQYGIKLLNKAFIWD